MTSPMTNIAYPAPLNSTELNAVAYDPTTGNQVDGTIYLPLAQTSIQRGGVPNY
jgi:hypothetical protein